MTKDIPLDEPISTVVALTPDKIHHEISKHISRGVSYIEALVDYAEKNEIEIETVKARNNDNSWIRWQTINSGF